MSCSVEIVPDAGESSSEEEAAVAVQFLGTKDFLVEKVTVCAGELVVPYAAVNVRVVGK